MPYDGSGNFTIINNFEEDRINGVSIDSLKMDNNFDDIANGLSNVMLRSGSVVMTGILNMGDHKITNLVSGTSAKDAVNKEQMDTALSAKQATITGAASTITGDNLSLNRALVSSSSGKVTSSSTTSTEIGYVHGVTSAIQTQLNNKITATFVSGVSGSWKDNRNNFLINRGRDKLTSNVFQITFPEPFKSTNYSFVGIATDDRNSGYSYDAINGVTDRQKTYIKVYSHYGNQNIDWIAMGY